jgi:hypothetical protein
MKFLAITLTMAGVLAACGCRHEYEPAPPPYYCRPACGCAPAYAPPCNPCAPAATPYLQPTPTTIPRAVPYAGAPGGGAYTAPGGTYAPPGVNPYATPGVNPNPSLPPR